MTRDLYKHPTFTATQDIKDICKPLLKLNITYFAHARIDNNSELTGLSTCPDYADYYFTNKFYNADIHVAKERTFGKYIIWDEFELAGQSEKMILEGQAMGHHHLFTITQQSPLGKDFYHFATNINNRAINQLYLNNIDLLEKFIQYFNKRIKETDNLIKAYEIKYGVERNIAEYSLHSESNLLTQFDRTEFLKELDEEFCLLNKSTGDKTVLSPQQTLCLYHLLDGKSAKQIARELKISHRTVEHHILKIRNITGCQSSKELISSYASQIIKPT